MKYNQDLLFVRHGDGLDKLAICTVIDRKGNDYIVVPTEPVPVGSDLNATGNQLYPDGINSRWFYSIDTAIEKVNRAITNDPTRYMEKEDFLYIIENETDDILTCRVTSVSHKEGIFTVKSVFKDNAKVDDKYNISDLGKTWWRYKEDAKKVYKERKRTKDEIKIGDTIYLLYQLDKVIKPARVVSKKFANTVEVIIDCGDGSETYHTCYTEFENSVWFRTKEDAEKHLGKIIAIENSNTVNDQVQKAEDYIVASIFKEAIKLMVADTKVNCKDMKPAKMYEYVEDKVYGVVANMMYDGEFDKRATIFAKVIELIKKHLKEFRGKEEVE